MRGEEIQHRSLGCNFAWMHVSVIWPHIKAKEREREREREREKGQQGAVDGQVQQSNKIDSNTYFSDSWTQPRHGAKVERERERQCV